MSELEIGLVIIKAVDFAEIKGQVIKSINIYHDEDTCFSFVEVEDDSDYDLDEKQTIKTGDLIQIITNDAMYLMYHSDECCEKVCLEDIDGELREIIEEEVLFAEKVSNQKSNVRRTGTKTWTFFKLRTKDSDITLRWYGSSNGYYSEDVEFYKVVGVLEKSNERN